MQDSFVDRLSKALGRSPEAVDTLLEELSRSIRSELDESGRARIDEVGTIRREGGEIVFEPAPSLSRHCNRSYENLQPVIIPSEGQTESDYRRTEFLGSREGERPEEDTEDFDQPELTEPDEHAVEEEDIADLEALDGAGGEEFVPPAHAERDENEDTALAGPVPPALPEETETAAEAQDESLQEVPAGRIGEEQEPAAPGDEDEFAGIDEESDATVINAASREEERRAAEYAAEQEAEAGSIREEEPAAAEPSAAAALRIEKEPGGDVPPEETVLDKEERKRSLAPIIFGIFALAIVAALIFYLRPEADIPPEEQDIAAEQRAQDDVRALDPEEDAGPQEAPPPEPEPAGPPPTAVPDDDPLRADAPINIDAGGFTWIYASLASRRAAEEVADDYRRQGFRTGVIAEETAARTYYRVGVGQFQTAEGAIAAQDQLPSLPATTPGNPWLRRIQ